MKRRPLDAVLMLPNGDLVYSPDVHYAKPTGPLVHLASGLALILPEDFGLQLVAVSGGKSASMEKK